MEICVVIECGYKPCHNWMTFVSWYSVIKNLPDAEVAIACKRGPVKKQYYLWAKRAKANFFMYSDTYQFNRANKIIIQPHVMALRDYDAETAGPVPVQSNEIATFVDYSSGCGRFVVSEWIHKDMGPFQEAVRRFSAPEMSINEVRLLAIWQQSYGLYSALEGG